MSADFWLGLALTEVFALALLAFVFRRPLLEYRKNVWLKILLIALAMYLAFLFYALLRPVYFYRRFSFSADRLNLVPFRALKEWLANPFNFFGNVLLFMPLGFFEVLLHPGRSRKWQLLYTAATAAVLSLFIEFAQCFNYRVPDVDDVILNIIGAVLGALLCMLQQKAGFDRTRVGSILLPRIPRSWRRHMLLNRFCVILVVAMEIVLFTVNWIVTVPRPEVRENTAAQVNLSLPAASAAPEATNLPVITTEPEATAVPVVTTEPEATAVPVVTPEPEATDLPVITPVPEATDVPAPTPEVEITDVTVIAPEPVPAAERVYNTDNLALEAQNVLLVRLAGDGGSAEVIYAAGSSESIYPASTLKMLTALTVLNAASPGDQVQIGTEIYIPPLDASRAGLEYGMTLTVRELLEGLLLPSGADAAYALGVYCGRQLAGDSQLSAEQAVARFIEEMNRKASALGASDTTVKNVVGLDDKGQKTTAEDILRIAKAFLDQPVLAEICSLPTDRITSAEGKSVSLSNTNKMLHLDSGYYNGDIAGVKTGTTSRAGNCLVSVFTIQGERYLCVVMHSSYYGKFTDTQMLYDMCADACGN